MAVFEHVLLEDPADVLEFLGTISSKMQPAQASAGEAEDAEATDRGNAADPVNRDAVLQPAKTSRWFQFSRSYSPCVRVRANIMDYVVARENRDAICTPRTFAVRVHDDSVELLTTIDQTRTLTIELR